MLTMMCVFTTENFLKMLVFNMVSCMLHFVMITVMLIKRSSISMIVFVVLIIVVMSVMVVTRLMAMHISWTIISIVTSLMIVAILFKIKI